MNKKRRLLIQSASGLVAGSVATSTLAKNASNKPLAAQINHEKVNTMLWEVSTRTRENYIKRVKAAGAHLLSAIDQQAQAVNNDEQDVPNYAGNFSKTLPHNDLGEVDTDAYTILVNGLENGDFSGLTLSNEAERTLANPSAYKSFDLHGGFADATRLAPAPATQSAHAAAEMIEVYWQALTRDINFRDYGTSALISRAVDDMNNATFLLGPTTNGQITTNDLFKGSTLGDKQGPYISQFLWQPFNYGAIPVKQKYPQPQAGLDHMITYEDFLSIQNGASPIASQPFGPTRYIQNNRDLANYVHSDVLFEAYYNATIILLQKKVPLLPNSPLSNTVESGFVTFGGPDVLNMVATAGRMALTGAWYHKWLHRKLRPEAFGGLVEHQRLGNADYGLHPDLMTSDAVKETVNKQGNALLSQAYLEGSPTHPAYPAGHAFVAGACTTVMKAFFDEDAIFPNPMQPSQNGKTLEAINEELKVGGEINKLANNISIGRNAAGVHYRSDGEQGMIGGEQQAIGLLKDYSLSYGLDFDGFYLTKFDGTTIKVSNGKVNDV